MTGSKQELTGICENCGQTIPKKSMKSHLQKCYFAKGPDPEDKNSTDVFHISIEDKYEKIYWLHVTIPVGAKMKALDSFLRDIWLECCGHMSAFQYGPKGGSIAMNKVLDTVIEPGLKFEHMYDFGTPTELTLKALSVQTVAAQKGVMLLARNLPPAIPCDKCGKPATQVCTECDWEECCYCNDCVENHEHGEEMLLPVVNSPRTGVCGYCG